MLDLTASIHVCRDQRMFDILELEGDFGHIQTIDNHKSKVDGVYWLLTARLINGTNWW